MKKFIMATLITLTPLITTGCLVAVAGGAAAGTAYVLGKLESSLEADLKKSDYAVTKAMKKLELIKISNDKTALEAVHVYRNSKDEKITVTLEKFTGKTTKIFIKVGLFGDESLSYTILETVKENL